MNRKVPNFKISGSLKSDIVNINDEIEGVFAIEVYIYNEELFFNSLN